MIYSDEYLDYCGDVFIAENLAEYGLAFETFLLYPTEIIKAIHACNFKPLLPAQRKIAAQLRYDEAMLELQKNEEKKLDNKHARCNNGTFIEHLIHRRFQRKPTHYINGKQV